MAKKVECKLHINVYIPDQITRIKRLITPNQFKKENARNDYLLTNSSEMDPNGISRDLAHKRFSGQVRSSQFETITTVLINFCHS